QRRRQSFQSPSRSQPPRTAGPPASQERPDAVGTLPGSRNEPPSGDQASAPAGRRQSGGHGQKRAREAALPQSRSHQRHQYALDRQVRAGPPTGASQPQTSSAGKGKRDMTEAPSEFVYTTYITSTPQKVWDAITTPEFTRQYWGSANVSDWKPGSK